RGRVPGWQASGSGGGAADGGADGGEGLVGVGAEGRDRGNADHDDQGQHHGVLDRRRAVLTLQKIHHALSKLTHRTVLSVAWRSGLDVGPRRTHGFAPPPHDGFAVSRMTAPRTVSRDAYHSIGQENAFCQEKYG